MTSETKNYCTRIKQLKPELAGTECCSSCHNLMDRSNTKTQSGLCCTVDHRDTLYRPSSRRVSPLRS